MLILLMPLALLLALGLPAAGVWLAGRPLELYMEFPPVTRHVQHAAFSWPVFCVLALAAAVTLAPFLLRLPRRMPDVHGVDIRSRAPGLRFPWWGWLALLGGVASWLLAWKRFAWFAPLQPFTFSPLWLFYIVTVNALTWKRTGRCMMLHQRRRFFLLFAVSAAFWWYFEYLNRFVQNWDYEGVSGLSPAQYLLFATLPFSTVLPAVMGTCELLESFPRLRFAWETFLPVRPRRPRALATAALLAGAVTLAAIGIWPDYFFPLLWISPLLIVSGLQALLGRPTVFAPLARGNWHRICLLGLSSLICGFFWEMWNYHSMARWIYAVPYVQRFHVFEMPLLGFLGYIPFGLECAAIADLLDRNTPSGCHETAERK